MGNRIIEKLGEMHKQKYGNDDCLDGNRFDNLSSIMISPNEISNVLYATNNYVQMSQKGEKPTDEMNTFSFIQEMQESQK